MNTPVLSFARSVRSRSDFFCTSSLYASIAAFCSAVVILSTSGCSGERTAYVAPNNVSGRVVNTVNDSLCPSMSNVISAPSERPIQFRCMSFRLSGQSSSSKSSSRRSA